MPGPLTRRVILSGFALPAIAGLGISRIATPASAQRHALLNDGNDGEDGDGDDRDDGGDRGEWHGRDEDGRVAAGARRRALAGGCPPAFSAGTHETVLTEEAAKALADAGITFAPAAGSTVVEAAARPSAKLTLSAGSAALDLLTGVVSFDRGFAFTKGQGKSGEAAAAPKVALSAFTSQLAERVSTGWLSVNGETGKRLPALTFDLSKSTIKIEGTSLSLESYDMLLAPQAISELKGVFSNFPLTSDKPFAQGSATGTFLRS